MHSNLIAKRDKAVMGRLVPIRVKHMKKEDPYGMSFTFGTIP